MHGRYRSSTGRRCVQIDAQPMAQPQAVAGAAQPSSRGPGPAERQTAGVQQGAGPGGGRRAHTTHARRDAVCGSASRYVHVALHHMQDARQAQRHMTLTRDVRDDSWNLRMWIWHLRWLRSGSGVVESCDMQQHICMLAHLCAILPRVAAHHLDLTKYLTSSSRCRSEKVTGYAR